MSKSRKTTIAIITNIPSPYRLDLFYFMQTNFNQYKIHIIYANKNEDNRQWTIDEQKMLHTTILDSKTLKLHGDIDTRYIHLPVGLLSTLNKINPDVVIAWEYNPVALQTLIWCKLKKRKFIHITDGTLNSEKSVNNIQKLSRRFIIKYSNAYIASSTKAKEKLLFYGAAENKIFVSLLTVNVNQYIGLNRNIQKGQLLYVGSMVKRKGLDLLINALPFVQSEFTLHIVGNGTVDEKNELIALADKLEVLDKIDWRGFVQGQALLNEYAQSEIFILPTREDCFGLVLLEAFCAKVPIICSKYADGAYDIVDDGKNGYIIDPYDAKSLGTIIHNSLKNENIQRAATECTFEAFTFENVAKGYLSAIASVQGLEPRD